MSDSWVYFQGSLIVYRPVVMLWGVAGRFSAGRVRLIFAGWLPHDELFGWSVSVSRIERQRVWGLSAHSACLELAPACCHLPLPFTLGRRALVRPRS